MSNLEFQQACLVLQQWPANMLLSSNEKVSALNVYCRNYKKAIETYVCNALQLWMWYSWMCWSQWCSTHEQEKSNKYCTKKKEWHITIALSKGKWANRFSRMVLINHSHADNRCLLKLITPKTLSISLYRRSAICVSILTPIPCGRMDGGHQSQRGCPYSLPFLTRPFLKSCKSHPSRPLRNTL